MYGLLTSSPQAPVVERQTRSTQNRMPKGVRVRIPLGAHDSKPQIRFNLCGGRL